MGNVVVNELSPLHDEQSEVLVKVISLGGHMSAEGAGRGQGRPRHAQSRGVGTCNK